MTNPAIQLKDLQAQFKRLSANSAHDAPFVFEETATISMHFNQHSIQSVMYKDDPEYLVLGYTRSMMGFLFFQPQPANIAMIGLGGGSLAKYCVKHLPDVHFTAIEINAQVIALRDQFNIPADSSKFSVLHANGADYVANKVGKVDVLLIDGFDENGHPAKLCSAGFYDNCYSKLNNNGVMVVNLLASDQKFGTYAARMRDSFEDKVVVIDAEEDGNKIAFAFKGDNFPLSRESIVDSIRTLEPKYPIPLQQTAKRIMQRFEMHTSHSEFEQLFGASL